MEEVLIQLLMNPLLIVGGSGTTLDNVFVTIERYVFQENNETINDYQKKMLKEYQYNGSSKTQCKLNEVYVIVGIMQLYVYYLSFNLVVPDDSTSWDSFIAYYDLSETISKIKCDNVINIMDIKRQIDEQL